MLRPATAAVPWPMTRTLVMLPSASRARMSGGSARAPTEARRRPSTSTILPRSVLRKLSGASLISFSRKCGESPRSMSRVVTWAVATSPSVERQLGAVVGEPADAGELAGLRTVEHEDLTATARRRQRLAVDAHELRGLLDDAVRLAGDDEAVVGQADVERLAAAAQREEQLIGLVGRGSADRHAALELGDRAPERLAEVAYAAAPTWWAITAGITLASVVIGPAMRRPWWTLRSAWLSTSPLSAATMYGAPPGLLELLAVQRMAVGLADDADAGPAGVAEHRQPCLGLRQREAQQVVAGDRGAQRPGVVAELADLGGRLVDEAEALTGDAHRAVLEQRVGCCARTAPAARPGRSPTARGSRRTGGARPSRDRGPRAGRAPTAPAARPGTRRARPPCVAPAKRLDLARRAQPVVADGPRRVAELDQLGGDSFVLVGIERRVELDSALDLGDPGVELVEPGDDADDQFVAADEREHPGHALQQFIASSNRSRPPRQARRQRPPDRDGRAPRRARAPVAARAC